MVQDYTTVYQSMDDDDILGWGDQWLVCKAIIVSDWLSAKAATWKFYDENIYNQYRCCILVWYGLVWFGMVLWFYGFMVLWLHFIFFYNFVLVI